MILRGCHVVDEEGRSVEVVELVADVVLGGELVGTGFGGGEFGVVDGRRIQFLEMSLGALMMGMPQADYNSATSLKILSLREQLDDLVGPSSARGISSNSDPPCVLFCYKIYRLAKRRSLMMMMAGR